MQACLVSQSMHHSKVKVSNKDKKVKYTYTHLLILNSFILGNTFAYQQDVLGVGSSNNNA